MASPRRAAFARLVDRCAKRREVINLAIERHDETPRRRQHRLRARFGKIEYRKAVVTERRREIGIAPQAVRVRSAMRQRGDHGTNAIEDRFARASKGDHSGDAAHDGLAFAERRRGAIRRIPQNC